MSIDEKTPLEPLNPVAEIGQTVQVTGGVRHQYHGRQILIDQISLSIIYSVFSLPD